MIINYNFKNNLKIELINIDDYPKSIFDKKESISHNSVNAHNYDLIKNYVNHNISVLEIGCGSYSFFKENTKTINYDGLETLFFKNHNKKKKIYNLIGTVTNIPTKKKYDLIFSNQSIEHWHEYNDTIDEGLTEVNRVLKKNGIFAFNFPFFLHGHKKFVQGDLDWLLSKIDADKWKIINIKFYYSELAENYQGWRLTGFPNFFIRKIHKNTMTSFNASIDLQKIDNYSHKKIKKKSMSKISRYQRNLHYGFSIFIYRAVRSIWNRIIYTKK